MSLEDVTNRLNRERLLISETILRLEENIKSKSIMRVISKLRDPLTLFLETVIVTIISSILFTPLYNFIFAVPLSPVTVVVFLALMVFILIIPINLFLSYIYTLTKNRLIDKMGLQEKLRSLTSFEQRFLREIFPKFQVEANPRKINVLTEIEIDRDVLSSGLLYTDYYFKTQESSFSFRSERFYKDVSGKYLVYEECLSHNRNKAEFIVRDNCIEKKIENDSKLKLRFLPAYRLLTKQLYNLNKKLSENKRTVIDIQGDKLRLVFYEPTPLGPEWVSANFLQTIDSLKRFLNANL